MALGGFEYAASVLLGPHGNTRAEWEADWNALLASFHGLTGWSAHTALTRMVDLDPSGNAFAISQFGAGNLGYLCWVFNNTNFGTMIHADNNFAGVARIANSGTAPCIYCAWIPPGAAVPTSGDPRDASWLPAEALKFQGLTETEWDDIVTGGQARFHFMARDANVIIAVEDSAHLSTVIDQLYVVGNIIDAPSQSGDTYTEAALGWVSNGNQGITPGTTVDRRFQVKRADGVIVTSTGTTSGVLIAFDLTRTGVLVNDREPFNWSRGILYVSDADLDGKGIVPGNGVKGSVNPEILRFMRDGALTNKQQLESGNLIYVGDGVVIGWDSANGAMT